jgi:hypothetical protein
MAVAGCRLNLRIGSLDFAVKIAAIPPTAQLRSKESDS